MSELIDVRWNTMELSVKFLFLYVYFPLLYLMKLRIGEELTSTDQFWTVNCKIWWYARKLVRELDI